MSRPLPMCAWCGRSVARKERTEIRWQALPGVPGVAWHLRCLQPDPVWQSHEHLHDALATLSVVLGRGAARVVSRRRKGEKGGCRYVFRPGVRSDLRREIDGGQASAGRAE